MGGGRQSVISHRLYSDWHNLVAPFVCVCTSLLSGVGRGAKLGVVCEGNASISGIVIGFAVSLLFCWCCGVFEYALGVSSCCFEILFGLGRVCDGTAHVATAADGVFW